MRLDLSRVKLSRQDLKRKITIPKNLTSELAYDVGFMIGDGSINVYKTGTKTRYMIRCSCNLEEEKEFCENFLVPLKETLFNVRPRIRKRKKELQLIIYSKGILSFYHNVFDFPLGSKQKISVPNIIENSTPQLISQFIKGLADSDFCLTFKKKHKDINYYPVIKASFSSKALLKSLLRLLSRFHIKVSPKFDVKVQDKRTNKTYIRHEIYINGKKNLKRWIENIGFNNPKHLTKLRIWEKYGFCPVRTDIHQRMNILKRYNFS